MTAPLYLALRDFGSIGREGICDPQHTRNNVIDLIVSGEWDGVYQVLEIADGLAIDVTLEILEEAERRMPPDEPDPFYSPRALREETEADVRREMMEV